MKITRFQTLIVPLREEHERGGLCAWGDLYTADNRTDLITRLLRGENSYDTHPPALIYELDIEHDRAVNITDEIWNDVLEAYVEDATSQNEADDALPAFISDARHDGYGWVFRKTA